MESEVDGRWLDDQPAQRHDVVRSSIRSTSLAFDMNNAWLVMEAEFNGL